MWLKRLSPLTCSCLTQRPQCSGYLHGNPVCLWSRDAGWSSWGWSLPRAMSRVGGFRDELCPFALGLAGFDSLTWVSGCLAGWSSPTSPFSGDKWPQCHPGAQRRVGSHVENAPCTQRANGSLSGPSWLCVSRPGIRGHVLWGAAGSSVGPWQQAGDQGPRFALKPCTKTTALRAPWFIGCFQ